MEIKINAPGAGEWIMHEAGGIFTPGLAHSLSTHDGSKLLGGFVIGDFTGVCAGIHMAGKHPGWCNRDLLWMAHDYAFNVLNVKKLLAMVRSDNYQALAQELRAGYWVETLIRDMYGDGIHAFILAMTPDRCSWLNYTPKDWYRLTNTVTSITPCQDVA